MFKGTREASSELAEFDGMSDAELLSEYSLLQDRVRAALEIRNLSAENSKKEKIQTAIAHGFKGLGHMRSVIDKRGLTAPTIQELESEVKRLENERSKKTE